MLQDHRQVKGVTGAYTRFYIDRQASGDFKGLKAKEAATLAGREWKGLSASEKKVNNAFSMVLLNALTNC